MLKQKFAPSEAKRLAMDLAAKIGRMGPEERQAIADQLPVVINPDGHALTPLNTILLCQQSKRTDLTIVAGFKQWVKVKRVVRKGEKSIGFIRVPLHVVARENRGSDGKPLPGKEDSKALRFRFVAVFDVSQTDELGGVVEEQDIHSEDMQDVA